MDKLKTEYPQLEIEKIDVLLQPLTALKNNIKMIPALKAGNLTISGLFLSERKIRNFIDHYLKSL